MQARLYSLPPLWPGSLKLGHSQGVRSVAVLRAPTGKPGCRQTTGFHTPKSRTNGVKPSPAPRQAPSPSAQRGFAINKQTTAQTCCLMQNCRNTHFRSTPPGQREWGQGRRGEGGMGPRRGARGSGSYRHHSLLPAAQVTTERYSPTRGHTSHPFLAPVPGNRLPGSLCSGANFPNGERAAWGHQKCPGLCYPPSWVGCSWGQLHTPTQGSLWVRKGKAGSFQRPQLGGTYVTNAPRAR